MPPIKHLDELNRWIPRGKPFAFLTAEQAWPARPGRPRLAALSNFGFGGANAFFVIEEAPAAEEEPLPAPSDGPRFVCFRARTATSLRAMVERFRAAAAPPTDDMLYRANAHRSDFRERLAFCADDATALQACLAGRPGGTVYASDDFAAELYGSRAALVFGADDLGTSGPRRSTRCGAGRSPRACWPAGKRSGRRGASRTAARAVRRRRVS